MKKRNTIIIACILLFCMMLSSLPVALTAFAAGEDDVWLGDHRELVTSYACLGDTLGMNTAHSGDVLTVGTVTFDKGIGMHCNPAGTETYVELDISGTERNYFTAWVGAQSASKDGVFLEWASISFEVWGDGRQLIKTDVKRYQEEATQIICDIQGVKTLRLVQDCADGHSCDWGVWGNARLTNTLPESETLPEPAFNPDKTNQPTPAEVVSGDYAYISDMYWVDSHTYGGDIVRRDANTADEIIFDIDFRIFEKGLGMHGSSADFTSYVKVNIDGMGYTKFATFYGICDTMSGNDISMAGCHFAVIGDGKVLFRTTEPMTYGVPMVYVECDVTGVRELTVAIAAEPSIAGCWGTWGGAVLSKSGDVASLFADEPVTEAPTAPVTDPETDPVTQPATQPDTQPDTQPETQPETTSVTAPQSTTATPATEATPGTTAVAETTASAEDTTSAGTTGGCASSVGGLCLLLLSLPATALTLYKGKRERREQA